MDRALAYGACDKGSSPLGCKKKNMKNLTLIAVATILLCGCHTNRTPGTEVLDIDKLVDAIIQGVTLALVIQIFLKQREK